jgi:hypothetical protein
MRHNRILRLPGAPAFDAAAFEAARLIPETQLPSAAYGLVATCMLSLDAFLTAKGVRGRRLFRVYQGGWYRTIGVALPQGRFGRLTEFEHHPGEVRIELQVQRTQHLHREDFFLTQLLLAVTDAEVSLCDGPYLWT